MREVTEDAQDPGPPGPAHQIARLDGPPLLGHHCRELLALPGDCKAPACQGQWGFVLKFLFPWK